MTMNIFRKIIKFFKEPIRPKDPKLESIFENHELFKILILDVSEDSSIEHPWYLQDDDYSSWGKYFRDCDKKEDSQNKWLLKMGGPKLSVRPVKKGDIVSFATCLFKEEAVFWSGQVLRIDIPGRLYLKRMDHFCQRF
jgi:hypothetical protein